MLRHIEDRGINEMCVVDIRDRLYARFGQPSFRTRANDTMRRWYLLTTDHGDGSEDIQLWMADAALATVIPRVLMAMRR